MAEPNRELHLAGVLVYVMLAASAPVVVGQDAAGWRRNGTGVFPKASPVTEWGLDRNVVWATPMPNWGNASPVAVGDRVFVCAEPDTLICVDAATGKILWQKANGYEEATAGTEIEQPERPPTHASNGYSSPTPVSDGRQVYVLTGLGTAASYSLTGERRWIRLLGRPGHGWGHSASPILVGTRLIVHIADTITALAADTGQTVWEAKGGSVWGTPLAVEIGGEAAIFTTGGDLFRARDGARIAAELASMPWTSPIGGDGMIYVVDAAGARALKLPAQMADTVSLETVWEMKPAKDRYYASAMLHEGLLYAIHQGSHLSVIDAGDGTLVYEKGAGLPGTAYSSICLAGGHLFLSSEGGQTLLLTPGRVYNELGRNQLESFRTTPFFQGDRIYIRGKTTLYCIGPAAEGGAAGAAADK